ncbi:MAG TPA: hypothetical protein VFE51_25560 [Verrucomicrobiae bacterium]|nr:hypothetical protein [Verrucomicrobiae bacterium]
MAPGQRAQEEELLALERGWYVGSEQFRKELPAQMKVGPENYGEEVYQSGEQKALKLVESELKKLGWTGADLLERAKGDITKIRVAKKLRQETTMTLQWIANALHMGTKTHLSHLLYWHGKEKKKRRG